MVLKKAKYTELARFVTTQHDVKLEVTTLVVHAPAVVMKDLQEALKMLEIKDVIGVLHTAALTENAAILEFVLTS